MNSTHGISGSWKIVIHPKFAEHELSYAVLRPKSEVGEAALQRSQVTVCH